VARKLLMVWLVGWALFGFPWNGFVGRPQFQHLTLVPFRGARRRDQLLNFLYYVPLGFIGGMLGWPPAVVTGAAVGLSALTEAAQLFSTDRFPSLNDLFLNTAGALVGIALVGFIRARRRA
jgi:glycopeptide antibiotics resistance protein